MDHSAFTNEYWGFFNSLDDAVTMDSAQHARAAAAVCLAVGTAIDADGPGPHGSIAGRKATLSREFDVGVKRMMTGYFSETPRYEDKMFTRRFRMPRAVFDRIHKDVSARPEFMRKCDALGKPGLHTLQRVVAALRKLSYGVASDAVDEYVRISESSLMSRWPRFAVLFASCTASSVRVPTYTCNDTCIALSGRVQGHL
jgi:hypothetical protein